jgi:hypothetical protein
MRWALKCLVEPASEPVTTDEAKTFAHIDTSITSEDTLIGNLITSARKEVESYTRRQLISATWRLTMDSFPTGGMGWAMYGWDAPEAYASNSSFGSRRGHEIPVPLPPLATVSSIIYDDINNVATTMSSSDYRVLTDFEPGLIVPTYATFWPVSLPQIGAVRITFTNGYGASASYVPEKIKTAIKWLVSYWIENRLPTTAIPAGFYQMIQDYKHGYEFVGVYQ